MQIRYGMEFRHLHSFVEIARTGSYTAAARRLALTQPALSRQMDVLERELGVTVFHRTGRTIQLTSAGELLLPLALEAEDLHERMRGQGMPDVLHIAVGGSAAVSILPRILQALNRHHPSTQIRLIEATPPELERLARTGGADLLIHEEFTSTTSASGLISVPLYCDTVLPVVGAASRQMSLEAFRDSPLILFAAGSSLRHHAERILLRLHPSFRQHVAMELRTVAAMEAVLRVVPGVGFLSLPGRIASLSHGARGGLPPGLHILRLSGIEVERKRGITTEKGRGTRTARQTGLQAAWPSALHLSEERRFLISHLRERQRPLAPFVDEIRRAIPVGARIESAGSRPASDA